MTVLSLHSRFLTAEQQLLSAFGAGEDSLVAFADMWAILLSDFAWAKAMHRVDSDMSCLAHSVASRVAILTDSLLSLDVRASELRDKFSIRFAAILSTANMEEVPPTTILPSSLSPPTARDMSPLRTIPTPPHHIFRGPHSLHCLAQMWLVENVHKPYPSSALKTLMAEECHCSMKDVQDWFRDARRSIGWSALLQERFHGSRQAISDAAIRVYRINSDHTLSRDVITAFSAIKKNACDYQSGGCRCCSGDRSGASDSGLASLVSFPSPQPSVSSFADEEEDISQPLPVAGCKRQANSSPDPHSEAVEHSALLDFDIARSVKRRRCTPLASVDVQSWDVQPQDQLVAPTSASISYYRTHSDMSPSTVHNCGPLQPPDLPTLESSADSVNVTCGPLSLGPASSVSALYPSTVAKRRLSDATFPCLLKRPRGPLFGSRKQTVSEPLPVGLNSDQTGVLRIDDWLRSSWDIPEAIDTGNSDPSSLFNIELATHPTPFSESISSLSSPASYLDVPDADLVSATRDGFDFSTFNFSDLQPPSNLDLSNGVSVTPSVGLPCSSPSVNTPPELSESALMDNPSRADWSQFGDILNWLDLSPHQTPSSSCMAESGISDAALSSNSDGAVHTVFRTDPLSTSLDFLSDIGRVSSLHMPLEALF